MHQIHLLFRPGTVLLSLLFALLTGCGRPVQLPVQTPEKPTEGVASVMIDSVNYMHERGVHYTLYDLSQLKERAVGGAIVTMLATGGEKGCCLSLPEKWRPGMKVRLVWGESDRKQTYPEEHVRELEIPRYDTPSDLYVVFYPGHEVELVVSVGEPGHPTWRGRNKNTPWQQCLETYGRKPCKAALPKQFDTGSYQGYCPTALKEKRENAELHCEFLMYECMKDYEDEAFCKKILWGAAKK